MAVERQFPWFATSLSSMLAATAAVTPPPAAAVGPVVFGADPDSGKHPLDDMPRGGCGQTFRDTPRVFVVEEEKG